MRYDYYWYNANKKIDLRRVKGFGALAQTVIERGRTYLKHDRLYSLWQAVGQLDSDELAIAEIGAYRGGSARFVAEALHRHGRANRFYVCDTFCGHVSVDDRVDGPHQVGRQFMKASYDKVVRYLRPFPNVRVLEGDFRETCRELDGEDGFALVHIDVDVYPITRCCLDYFADRLVLVGVMVVDDYGFLTCTGAKQAVDEFVSARTGFWRLHLLTAQAVLIKTSVDEIDEDTIDRDISEGSNAGG
ncbi:MAG: TylF/MycF/NovP-related O-methyltransferase [Acidobacteriota bacterium]|nr:TylF/MycF/NovP-related O-methyltransferase [Acidobacteriota bacterium]